MSAAPANGPSAASPYVGPRPFRRGELFYGRERPTSGLVSTLIASRIVLLHSPSGAGKTSLIQAAVAPTMERRQFQVCAQRKPFSPARVSTPVPDGVTVENRYAAGVTTSLLAHRADTDPERSYTISEALDLLAKEPEAPEQQLLILDQFEEILTLDATDFEGQKNFFRQLGEALDSQSRWALIAMREDFMGGLDRFLRYIPGQLRTTFRLDLLDIESARRAITLPAEERGVDFAEDAAIRVIKDLQRVRTGSADGAANRRGTYIEPVFLQVVCDGLWRNVHERSSSVTRITDKDVQAFGPLDAALAVYYNAVLREASGGSRAIERQIRDWIEFQLLTKDRVRQQTRSRPDVAEPDVVLRALQQRYLVREDPRPHATWWELSHDRMINPIIDDNQAWRETLEPWQRAAYVWSRNRHDERYLVTGEALRAALSYRRRNDHLTDIERDFLVRSERDVAVRKKAVARATVGVNVLRVIVAMSLALNLVLLVLVLNS